MNIQKEIQRRITMTIRMEMKALKKGDLEAAVFFKRRLIRLEQFAVMAQNQVL